MINTQRLLDNFLQLVSIDAVSGNEIKVAEFLLSELAKLDVQAELKSSENIKGGNCGNVIANIPGTDPDMPAIMLSAHMDSIDTTAGINTIIEDGIIKTDGTTILSADDRSGIACILEIVKVLKENKIDYPPIKLVFTVVEEKGMLGAKDINPDELGVECGFIFDSGAQPGKIIAQAPTSVHIIIKVTGKAAHAATQAEEGINAIKIASNAIARLDTGRLSSTMTFNFGKITGGKVINTVPDYVEVEAECRSHDTDELSNKLEELKNVFNEEAEKLGGSAELIINEKYKNFKLSPDTATAKIACAAVDKSGLIPELLVYPGGSDANVFNNVGIPSVNFGMGYKNGHSTREYIPIKDLNKDAEIVLNVVQSAYTHFKNNK